MSVVARCNPHDKCGCCGEDMQSQFGYFDQDLNTLICPECSRRMGYIVAYLQSNKMPHCVQVTGGKKIERQ